MRLLILLSTFFLLGLGEFSGDYPVSHIRTMWQTCYRTSLFKNFGMPPMGHLIFCDCMIDTTRKNWSYDKMINTIVPDDEIRGRMSVVATRCLTDLGFLIQPERGKTPKEPPDVKPKIFFGSR